jgi:hypothetical protein
MESTAKDRSYSIRKTLAEGSVTTTTERTYYKGEIPAGSVVRVMNYTNAGFRGIEAYAYFVREGRYVIVSAGILKG